MCYFGVLVIIPNSDQIIKYIKEDTTKQKLEYAAQILYFVLDVCCMKHPVLLLSSTSVFILILILGMLFQDTTSRQDYIAWVYFHYFLFGYSLFLRIN